MVCLNTFEEIITGLLEEGIDVQVESVKVWCKVIMSDGGIVLNFCYRCRLSHDALGNQFRHLIQEGVDIVSVVQSNRQLNQYIGVFQSRLL